MYFYLFSFAVKSAGPMDDGTASIASSMTSGYAGSIASSVNSNASAKTPKSVPPDHVITLLEGKWTRKYCVYHECEDGHLDIKLISILMFLFPPFLSGMTTICHYALLDSPSPLAALYPTPGKLFEICKI